MPRSETYLALLSLFPATPEQTIASRKRTFHQWGGGMTEAVYLKRDEVMDVLEHAADGKLLTWVLAPRNDPQTLDFMCSCETFHRKGVFVSPSSNGQENKVHEVAGYGIASVFTPAWNRRKGYASHMMSLLHWVLAPRTSESNLGYFPQAWGQPPPEVKLAGDGYFSVLYSDVGAEFYNNSGPVGNKGGGWEVKEATSTVWQVPPLTGTVVDVGGAWSWLNDSDLEQVWKEEVDLIKADLARSAASQMTVSFLTDEGVAAFQSTRALFGREDEISMDIWGVKMDNLESPDDSKAPTATYATWSVDARPLPATLIVTRLRANDQTFPALLQKIQEAARKSGITRVEMWNLPDDLQKIAAKWDGKTFERNEHLPAIRWYGKGATQDIVWAFNEKFCWC